MQVDVKIFGGLEKCISGIKFGQPVSVDITEGFTGKMLLEKLSIPDEKVFTFLVNGLAKSIDDILSDGDCISIFPPLGGG